MSGAALALTAFGRPSPALIARADRGYARFLAVQAPDADTGEPRPARTVPLHAAGRLTEPAPAAT
ncbi:hypothetical protein [Streptomyces sp. NPDC004296]|uniref:hypothetical protein n=1 Tax=Streptomyces sp. NPDC004296 TaxID=3364697 RepID=UPI0036792DB9